MVCHLQMAWPEGQALGFSYANCVKTFSAVPGRKPDLFGLLKEIVGWSVRTSPLAVS
jgi:hypothetical protein